MLVIAVQKKSQLNLKMGLESMAKFTEDKIMK